MAQSTYITASCTIVNNTVYQNGTPIFNNSNVALPEFLLEFYRNLDLKYPKFHKMDNLSKLGWLAAEVLLKDSGLEGKYLPEDVGVILANSNSSLDTDLKYFETAKDFASPSLFVYTLPNIMMGEICIRHKFKGENAFFIFEKFDAVFIQQYVHNLFNNNTLQACICGWVELLKDEYKSVLFLVEKIPAQQIQKTALTNFTIDNLLKIYQAENG